MKLVAKISKNDSGWIGICKDGTTVSLYTWLIDNDIKAAYCGHNRSPANIWKVTIGNKHISFGHSLGGHNIDCDTKVIW